jgi:hypothetical protein
LPCPGARANQAVDKDVVSREWIAQLLAEWLVFAGVILDQIFGFPDQISQRAAGRQAAAEWAHGV